MMGFLSRELFPVVLNMSLTASIIIAFVLLARLLLKKAPKVFSYALWAVVLFRLLCPVSVSAGVSLLGMLDAPVRETASVTSSVEYVQPQLTAGTDPQADLSPSGAGEVGNEALSQGEKPPAAEPWATPISVLTCVWFAGILAMLGYSAVSLIRLRRKLVGAAPLYGNIYLADYISCPFVMGVLRPRIYLPSSLPEKERAYIILHERHHIRRLDHIFKVLAFAALCVHWFNPLVWAAFVLSGKDMEMSCDEAVVKKLGEEIRLDYSASLLRLATGRRVIAGMPLAFGEGDTGSRIKNLMNWKKPKVWLSLAAAAACVAVIVLCAANPASAEPGRADPDAQDTAPDTLLSEVGPEKDSPAADQPGSEGVENLLAAGHTADDPQPEAPVSPPSEADIHAAIMANHEAVNDTDAALPFYTEAHHIWSQTDTGDTCTVYALVWYATYDWNGQCVFLGGRSVPAALTFTWEDGWRLIKYWAPAEDENDTANIQANLPSDVARIALGEQDSDLAAQLNAQCNEAAERYYAQQPDLPAGKTFSTADVEFSGQPLETSADAMTYGERLAWVQAGPAYGGSTGYTSLGEYREGEGCLAYLGQWVGTPHSDQYGLTIRFADGTEASLPLPRSNGVGAAPPDSMEFRGGKLVYEIRFADEARTDDGQSLIHLKGTYHYEADLEAKTVSLSIL